MLILIAEVLILVLAWIIAHKVEELVHTDNVLIADTIFGSSYLGIISVGTFFVVKTFTAL